MPGQSAFAPAPPPAPGRPKSGTSYFSVPDINPVSASTTGSILSSTDYYAGFLVRSPIVLDQLAIEVVAGSATNIRIGLYAADLSWQPVGAPLADSGNLDAITPAVKTYSPSAAIVLPPGRYLTVYNADGTPNLRMVRADSPGAAGYDQALGASPVISTWRVARAYAAFPTPGTAWTTTTANATTATFHSIFLRVTAP
jgi:hypothetical protein